MSITGILSAWDATTGNNLWHSDYGSRFGQSHPHWGASTSPIVDGNRVIVHFGTDDQGALIALDAESGEEIWSYGNDGASYASPILVDGKIYAISEDGVTTVVKAGRDFEILAKNSLPGYTLSASQHALRISSRTWTRSKQLSSAMIGTPVSASRRKLRT